MQDLNAGAQQVKWCNSYQFSQAFVWCGYATLAYTVMIKSCWVTHLIWWNWPGSVISTDSFFCLLDKSFNLSPIPWKKNKIMIIIIDYSWCHIFTKAYRCATKLRDKNEHHDETLMCKPLAAIMPFQTTNIKPFHKTLYSLFVLSFFSSSFCHVKQVFCVFLLQRWQICWNFAHWLVISRKKKKKKHTKKAAYIYSFSTLLIAFT